VDTIFINILFDNKSHVTETQIDQVSENNKVMRLDFHSVAVLGFKGAVVHFEIFHLEVVSYNFTALNTVNKIILFSDVRVSDFILEEHSVVITVETFFFYIFFNIPNDYAIFSRTLFHKDAYDAIVTPCSDFLYKGSYLFLRYINFYFGNFFGF